MFYEECSSCGEKVLSPKISQELFQKIKNREFVEETVKIPVLDRAGGVNKKAQIGQRAGMLLAGRKRD